MMKTKNNYNVTINMDNEYKFSRLAWLISQRNLGAKFIFSPMRLKDGIGNDLFKLLDRFSDERNFIIRGATGSGKTYQSVHSARGKFIYLAPCRQLVYETYIKYGKKGDDHLTTGEVKINGGDGNIFGVYESITEEDLTGFNTIIIDEGHFINDEDRGAHLMNLIIEAQKLKLTVMLVSATVNFRLDGFRTLQLCSKFDTPEKVEIDSDQFYENVVDHKMQSIIFAPSIDDTEAIAAHYRSIGVNAIAFNSSMLPSERLALQIAFSKKEVQLIVSTNVLAQGVNFECENLWIMDDAFNSPELLEQKLGRLGRPMMGNRKEVYYCLESDLERVSKTTTKLKKHRVDRDFEKRHLLSAIRSCKWGRQASYGQVKYALSQFKNVFSKKQLRDNFNSKTERKAFRKTYKMIMLEEMKIKQIILDNMVN